jgi:uncharacterized protein (TIGR01777 family)
VHSAGEGLLGPLALATRLFAGGPLAGGRQWMSWVGLNDWVSVVRLALTTSLAGPINIVAPNPVRNKDFTRALGKVLHRPTPWPIPRLALRVVLGEFANEAVLSQRVLPGVLRDNGFRFRYSTVDEALAAVL